MSDLNIEHYAVGEGTDPGFNSESKWYPVVVFRASGIVVDGRPDTQYVCRSPAEGIPFSLYMMDDTHGSNSLLLRFGETHTEGGYLVAEEDDNEDLKLHLERPNLASDPSFTLSGRLAVPDDLEETIDRRDRTEELMEILTVTPVTNNGDSGVRLTANNQTEKGAQIELTPSQTTVLIDVLHDYLNIESLRWDSAAPETELVEPDGNRTTMQFTPS